MTERCQTKFIENFDNKNYIVYVGILCTSFAVLYFYRFHFAIIAFSYVLGCLACYYGLNSNILRNYVSTLKCHLFGDTTEDVQDIPVKSCVTCGSKQCNRHDSSTNTEPWVGLQIHKQLDQAIQDFYNTILDQFINTWYSKISLQPFFVDELRHQLRYASACLLQRALKINYSRLITDRLVPCALRHYTLCSAHSDHKFSIHPAAANRAAELNYLRCVTNAIMPYLLRSQELENTVFRVLIREIFAGWVLLSLTDVLADPYILNTLIILATGDETMAQLPTTPNYKVEFLETFVRQTDSVYAQRCRLLNIDLDVLMSDQEHLYAFMQYMKTTCHIHLLQFYRDIKTFQTKILNPDLSEAEKKELHREACDIYKLYISEESVSRVPLQTALAEELHELLRGNDSIKRLQTSRALYQAARQSHAVLEKIMLPRFLHSEEFYKLLIGTRVPTGYQKNLARKPHERLMQSALKLGNKLKGALKSTTIDGQVLDCFANIDETEVDGVDNVDILKYLDSIAADDMQGDDLGNYKVVLTNVETRLQAPPRRGTVRVFSLAVHRAPRAPRAPRASPAPPAARGAAALWALERTEHDFHLLRSKLHEFHGDALLHDLPLPSRRDNSPLETLRYKYEDFLQRLLQKSLLQTSELLRIFLTEDGDFAMVVQASTLNATSTDLVNIYQSVTHKLRKEKGQHLESFLRNLLVSSDMDRYQALKQGTTREVEEAQEMSEDIQVEQVQLRKQNRVRNIHNTKFQNNFDVTPTVEIRDTHHQDDVVGFTQCLMFILIKVLNTRSFVSGVVGSILGLARELLDDAFNKYLNSKLCELLSERRLAHLITLGQGLLFGKKSTQPRNNSAVQRELARRQLMDSLPGAAYGLGSTALAVHNAFEIIQKPRYNKQLVYNLLDLCIVELFPELKSTEGNPTREPKS